MIRVFILLLLTVLLAPSSFGFFWNKKEKPSLFLSPNDPRAEIAYELPLVNHAVFKKLDRIYFLVYVPEGFKSDYIKYQIVKQDDKAHVGGYTRIRNKTCRVSDKNYYIDYFVIQEAGKYIIQIFDIENLHQWITFGHFRVVDE
ncbi:hypothetical protein IJX73_02540 [bacterium]|nr:hypothetical protein [bacterium]